MSTGRNDRCPCGSGKKYKNCCLGKATPEEAKRNKLTMVMVIGVLVLSVVAYFAASQEIAGLVAVVGIAAIGVWKWMTAQPPKSGGGSDPSAINFGR